MEIGEYMEPIAEAELKNYILIPTKRLRLKRMVFGRFSVEKEVAIYNLWSSYRKQSSQPLSHFWCEFTEEDAKSMDLDLESIFQLKTNY